MQKHLIAFDLDGTVLPTIKELNKRTIETVKEAVKQGHIAMIATARPLAMAKWVHDAMELDTPLCLLNGAVLYNPSEPNPIITKETIGDATVVALLSEIFATTDDFHHVYIENMDDFYSFEGNHGPYYRERLRVSNYTKFDKHNIPKTEACRIILTTENKPDVDKIVEITSEYKNVKTLVIKNKSSALYRCMIFNENADKWNAVKQVAKMYNVPKDYIYTFGDEWNDYNMLVGTPLGHAMLGSWAEQHASNKTRLSCADCGVADIIEHKILK